MTAVVRDPWEDARLAATEPVLGPDLVAVRRRIWLRRALTLVAVGLVLLGASFALDRLAPDHPELWDVPWDVAKAGLGLSGVGLLLMVAGSVRSSSAGFDRSFVGPDAYLSRADRSWVRQQIAEGREVPPERRQVVVAVAGRMRGDGAQVLSDLGLVCLYVGMVVSAPFLSSLVLFAILTVWIIVRMVRALLWSRRARRWLRLHQADLS